MVNLNETITSIINSLELNDENLFKDKIKVLKEERFTNGLSLFSTLDELEPAFICTYIPWKHIIGVKIEGMNLSIFVEIDDNDAFEKLYGFLKKHDYVF